jgi:hypothetical protein
VSASTQIPPWRQRDYELCRMCEGYACEDGCRHRTGCRRKYDGPDSHRVCRACGGSGREAAS